MYSHLDSNVFPLGCIWLGHHRTSIFQAIYLVISYVLTELHNILSYRDNLIIHHLEHYREQYIVIYNLFLLR